MFRFTGIMGMVEMVPLTIISIISSEFLRITHHGLGIVPHSLVLSLRGEWYPHSSQMHSYRIFTWRIGQKFAKIPPVEEALHERLDRSGLNLLVLNDENIAHVS